MTRPRGLRRRVLAVACALGVLGVTMVIGPGGPGRGNTALANFYGSYPCARYYVATGDGVPAGQDDSMDDSFANKLLTDHLQKQVSASGPWCLQNLSADKTTTDTYVTGSSAQMAQEATYKPYLVTVQLGRQNDGIVDSITTCLQDIKDHNFIDANTCALQILANQSLFDKLTKDLSTILGKYQTQMSGNPKEILAVIGYYNPYPHSTTVLTKMPDFCTQVTDTIPTCLVRWVLLPPALISLDQVFKKVDSTIQPVVQKFTQGLQGRVVFVNPYDEFNDHCTAMDVKINTMVYHPTTTEHPHPDNTNNSTSFGCDSDGGSTYIQSDGSDGTMNPLLYLMPAIDGVLIFADQTTSKMGVNPNGDGHKCLSTLTWAAVAVKLGYPTQPDTKC